MLFAIMILGMSICAFTQEETKMAIDLGPEFNMNSRYNFAGGAVLGFDYNLPVAVAPFAAGISFTTSTNFFGIIILEPAAMFRWYFLGSGHTGLFAQADVGVWLLFEDEETTPLFTGGLRAGYRLPFGSMFYVEPYGRLGYPFAFGIGALAGIRL